MRRIDAPPAFLPHFFLNLPRTMFSRGGDTVATRAHKTRVAHATIF
jgi:hypothetical protein